MQRTCSSLISIPPRAVVVCLCEYVEGRFWVSTLNEREAPKAVTRTFRKSRISMSLQDPTCSSYTSFVRLFSSLNFSSSSSSLFSLSSPSSWTLNTSKTDFDMIYTIQNSFTCHLWFYSHHTSHNPFDSPQITISSQREKERDFEKLTLKTYSREFRERER